jgi:peroxiredoxin
MRSIARCNVIALFAVGLFANTSAMMINASLKIQLALLCTLSFSTAGAETLVIGEPAPDFALPALHGKNLRLSEYRSDVVVLNFWAAWCNRCGEAMPVLNSLYQAHQADGLQVLAVGVDYTHPSTAGFIADQKVSFPMLKDDAKHHVSKAYELGTLPLTLVIDREGNVRSIHEGFDADVSSQITAQVGKLLVE